MLWLEGLANKQSGFNAVYSKHIHFINEINHQAKSVIFPKYELKPWCKFLTTLYLPYKAVGESKETQKENTQH